MTRRNATRSRGEDAPRNALEYYHYAVQPQTVDPFLKDNNVGLGDYDRSELHQQLGTFADFLYGEAAFDTVLEARAARKARREAAREGFETHVPTDSGTRAVEIVPYDDAAGEWGSLDDYAAAQWEDLGVAAQVEAIRQFTDYEPGKPLPPAREFLARHELSRSKDGRLVSSAMTDTREIQERVEPATERS